MTLHGRTVLVTGADGFIGSHLVERLAELGAQVTGLAQYNAFDRVGWLDEVTCDVEIVRGDIRDPSLMRRLVAGKDIVFHLAALIGIPYSYTSPQSYVDVNVTGTLNVLEAARETGVSRIVHTSTSEVYGTAQYEPIDEKHPLVGQSPYAASKIGADMIAASFYRSFDVPVYILRPFNTFGPRQSERAVIPTVIRQALDDSCAEIRLGDLTPRRDFSFVEDTAAAFCALAVSERALPGHPYNAGTGAAVTIGEMVEKVSALTGSNKPIVNESVRRRPQGSEVTALLADARSLQAAADWSPSVDLDSGLQKTIAWWSERLSANKVRAGASFSS